MYFKLCKDRIQTGNFELSAMNRTIACMLANGYITPEQHKELLTMSRKYADPQMSVDLFVEIEDIKHRLEALENAKESPEAGIPTVTYPEFVKGKNYKSGDKITFENERYECIAPEGQPCVWSPYDFPNYWNAI